MLENCTSKNISQIISQIQERFADVEFVKLDDSILAYQLTKQADFNTPLKLAFYYPRPAINLTGKDAHDFLQGIITADINQAKENKGIRSLILSPKGKILFDLLIEKIDEDSYNLYVQPGEAQALKQHLDFYHIIEDINLKLNLDNYFWCILSQSSLDLDYFFKSKSATWLKNVPIDQLPTDVQPIGLVEFEQIRAVFGFKQAGRDFDSSHYPLEAGLNDYVSYIKGCFIGQEPVARMTHKGRATKLLKHCVHSHIIDLEGDLSIYSKEQRVGKITSSSNYQSEAGYHSIGFFKPDYLEDLVVQNGSLSLLE